MFSFISKQKNSQVLPYYYLKLASAYYSIAANINFLRFLPNLGCFCKSELSHCFSVSRTFSTMQTILESLAQGSLDQPDKQVWTFLNDKGDPVDGYTYKVSTKCLLLI